MSKTDDALASQTALLNKFAEIIRNLIQRVSTAENDRDAALGQVASLLGADQTTATAILGDSPHIQALIDEALAVLPPEPVPAAA
ncbi:MAG: hypothetical protein V7K27_02395 [Nostoc sp.]|uniref:hypothetical protein n=1 Tax=Nostoc sp. TaxID=1180 RepID=UPI002FFA85E6